MWITFFIKVLTPIKKLYILKVLYDMADPGMQNRKTSKYEPEIKKILSQLVLLSHNIKNLMRRA